MNVHKKKYQELYSFSVMWMKSNAQKTEALGVINQRKEKKKFPRELYKKPVELVSNLYLGMRRKLILRQIE